MKESLKQFRDFYLDEVLTFLWRQWSALGVAGADSGEDEWVIDPEALLLFSCTMARYEVRLFDEILDWLVKNGCMLNINRLKSMMKNDLFTGKETLAAIAGFMGKRGKQSKWNTLGKKPENLPEMNLFYRKNNTPLKVFGEPNPDFKEYGMLCENFTLRGYSQPVAGNRNTGFLFKLRYLLGVNARSEILLYLLTHESDHPSRIARRTCYYQKTVQDTLVEMSRSGLVRIRPMGKEKYYWLKREDWLQLFHKGNKALLWRNWPLLFSSLEKIWLKLNNEKFLDMEAMLQASELRSLVGEIRPLIRRTGFAQCLSDDRNYPGEKYTPVFLADIVNLLKQLAAPGAKKL